jgi:hypothetical protein
MVHLEWCIKDYTVSAKCKKEYYACADNCGTTTDFDVDIEGAIVDEA